MVFAVITEFGITECGESGTSLINGTQAEISGKRIENGQSYYCYGLKITKRAKTKYYGDLASMKNFRFQVRGMSQTVSKARKKKRKKKRKKMLSKLRGT